MRQPNLHGKETRWMGTLNHYRHCNTYAEAESFYESIKPVRGENGHLDLRPLSGRGRVDMRIIKRPDEYVLTNDWNALWHRRKPRPNSYPTLRPVPSEDILQRMENLIVFTPDDVVTIYHPVTEHSPSGQPQQLVCTDFAIGIFCFLDRFLPQGMSAVRYDGKVYIQIEPKGKHGFRQYLVPRDADGLRFKRVKGDWKCLNPVQEYKKLVDRKALNAFRANGFRKRCDEIEAITLMIDPSDVRHNGLNAPDARQALIEAVTSKSPFEIGQLLLGMRKRPPYYGQQFASVDWQEPDFIRQALNTIAPYVGDTFTVENWPIGQVCLNSRYDVRPKRVVVA